MHSGRRQILVLQFQLPLAVGQQSIGGSRELQPLVLRVEPADITEQVFCLWQHPQVSAEGHQQYSSVSIHFQYPYTFSCITRVQYPYTFSCIIRVEYSLQSEVCAKVAINLSFPPLSLPPLPSLPPPLTGGIWLS